MPHSHPIERLLSLPLFMGMSSEELTRLVEPIRLGFSKRDDGETIVSADALCSGLLFLFSGSARVTGSWDDGAMVIHEQIAAPSVIEPQHLFGLVQRYGRSYTSKGQSTTLFLPKADVLRLVATSVVFRLNLLSMLSTQQQRADQSRSSQPAVTLEDRLLTLFAGRCVTPRGEKVVRVTQTHLSQALGVAPQMISRALNRLEAAGRVSCRRGAITVAHLMDENK